MVHNSLTNLRCLFLQCWTSGSRMAAVLCRQSMHTHTHTFFSQFKQEHYTFLFIGLFIPANLVRESHQCANTSFYSLTYTNHQVINAAVKTNLTRTHYLLHWKLRCHSFVTCFINLFLAEFNCSRKIDLQYYEASRRITTKMFPLGLIITYNYGFWKKDFTLAIFACWTFCVHNVLVLDQWKKTILNYFISNSKLTPSPLWQTPQGKYFD